MVANEESALKIAEFLLESKAVLISPKDPFIWASGWKSPIYCDNRITLSFPRIRTLIRKELISTIETNFSKPDVIAGVATGGIPHGVMVAHEMELPFAYVRPEPKAHGLKKIIEGVIEKGKSIIVIEDLISTGGSSMNVVKQLQDNGCNVKGLVSVFSYDFTASVERFKKAGCPVYSLCNYDILIKAALDCKYINEEQYGAIADWRKNPEDWQPAG